MKLTGQAFIGATRVAGQGDTLQATDPANIRHGHVYRSLVK